MPLWWPFPTALAFFLSVGLTPLVLRLARTLTIVDEPTGERKIHTQAVPLLGGLAIFVAVAIPLILVAIFSQALTSGEMHSVQIFGYLLGGLVLMIGGVLDDKYALPAKWSLFFPLLAASIATLSGIGVAKITNPLGGVLFVAPFVSMVFTFVWLLGMTYTTKLLDGVDGLATSVTTVGVLMVTALSLTHAYFQPDATFFSCIVAAALVGFLLFNLHPARIFLGEGGSTFLGFTLGVLAVISGSKVATVLLVLGVPLLDMLVVILRRVFTQRSLVVGDRLHLHHLLFDAGLSQRQIVFFYTALCTLFGVSSLIFSSFGKLLALFLLVIFVLLTIRILSRRVKKHL